MLEQVTYGADSPNPQMLIVNDEKFVLTLRITDHQTLHTEESLGRNSFSLKTEGKMNNIDNKRNSHQVSGSSKPIQPSGYSTSPKEDKKYKKFDSMKETSKKKEEVEAPLKPMKTTQFKPRANPEVDISLDEGIPASMMHELKPVPVQKAVSINMKPGGLNQSPMSSPLQDKETAKVPSNIEIKEAKTAKNPKSQEQAPTPKKLSEDAWDGGFENKLPNGKLPDLDSNSIPSRASKK